MLQQRDFMVDSLGECRVDSPLRFDVPGRHAGRFFFVDDSTRNPFNVEITPEPHEQDSLSFEEAGPREKIFFNPADTTAAIITCGGLSPGINNVIRSAYYELSENYGVGRVLGIRNGYLGLNPESKLDPIPLTREFVEPIDKLGGTVLGSSRGPQEPAVMAEFLQSQKVNILLCIGGDGTQRGAAALQEEIRKLGLTIAIVGVPKTIDNDIPFVRMSFGYTTSLEKAAEVIRGAHVEARSAVHGIGLVKLMGRHAGFIAAGATVVSQEVNFCLVPEIEFPLTGENGFLPALQKRMRKRGHAVVVVAEGAGQHLFEQPTERCDSSGNLLHADIGDFLRTKIGNYFAENNFPVTIKYLDPSYHIRSVPADVYDRYLCDQFARHAVHAAMAGKTGILVGFEHQEFINVPIPAAVRQKKQMDPVGDLWRAVLQVTRQPRW